jgi:hypothetical protein
MQHTLSMVRCMKPQEGCNSATATNMQVWVCAWLHPWWYNGLSGARALQVLPGAASASPPSSAAHLHQVHVGLAP